MSDLFKAIKFHFYTLKFLGYFPFHFDKNFNVKSSLFDIVFSSFATLIVLYTVIKRTIIIGGTTSYGSSWSDFNQSLGVVAAAIFATISIFLNFVQRNSYKEIFARLASCDAKVKINLIQINFKKISILDGIKFKNYYEF